MSVSSIFNNVSSTDQLSALSTPGAAASGASSGTSVLTSAASATSVSSDASLLSQLQQLSFTNPAAFKTATANIATQLQADAQQAGGSQGQALSSLAAKFQQASQTGSLTPLTPTHSRHGGHHHGGGGSSAASAASAYQDTTDSNTAAAPTSLQSQLSTALSQALTEDAGTQATLTAQNDLARPITSLAA